MPIKHLTLFVAAICLLASCKKNNSKSSGNANQLKYYIESGQTGGTNYIDTFTVSYDNDGRITGVISPALKFQYTYQSKSFSLDLYENGELSIHENAFIGSNNYVDSTFQYNDTNDTTTAGYYFNGAQLNSLVTYNYSVYGTTISSLDQYTYDNNGNLLKDVNSDGYGTVNIVYSFTYTTDPYVATINPTYFATQSKYLPATQTLTDGSGNPQGTITYTYVFDGSGRLTKQTETASNGDIGVKTYVYQ